MTEVAGGPRYRLVKRVIDVVLGVVALILASPLMVAIAVAIKLDSRGPAVFTQRRMGKHRTLFTMHKFRTMQHENDPSIHREYYTDLVRGTAEARTTEEGEPVFLLDDPRVTRVGRFLRKTSLDELPNLIDVIAGSMSLVGPRPPLDYEVELYDERAMQRLAVKPGMTGLAQISGRGSLTFPEIIEKDLEYIRTRSIRKDLAILAKTIPAVLRRRGV